MLYTVEIGAHLVWRFEKSSGGRVIGICDQLSLAIEGDNVDEARSIAREAMHNLFLLHLAEGTLEAFLRAKGWGISAVPELLGLEDSAVFNVASVETRWAG